MITSTIVVGFAIGLLVLCLLTKVLSLPIHMLWKFITNSVFGAFLLCIVNLFGAGIEINVVKALIAGIFGIPGVIAVLLYTYM
jgi:inhibitor of the pro-sigma K processing machinery